MDLAESTKGLGYESGDVYVILDALEALDALTGEDPVEAHITADDVLLRVAPKPVQDAYRRARARCGFDYT